MKTLLSVCSYGSSILLPILALIWGWWAMPISLIIVTILLVPFMMEMELQELHSVTNTPAGVWTGILCILMYVLISGGIIA